MKKFNTLFSAMIIASQIFSQTVSTFENLSLAPDSYWNGSDLSGGFSSSNAYFTNNYDTAFFSWNGFSYSNQQDDTTAGWSNQYSAITAGGYGGSANYAVAVDYGNAIVHLTGNAAGKYLEGVYVTNTTYTYLSMRDGDAFAKQFGGATGTDEDWFKLTVKGWLNGTQKNNEVVFYLADFRFADNTQDYIVHDWQWLNLQPLGNVDSIQFFLSSSDTGQWGMNTPAYFALDNFTTSDVTNVAPVANDDAATITYLQDTLIDVLSNDFDITATPLTVTLTSSPLIPGATALVVGNKIQYTPAVGIAATDTLIYSVSDGEGLSATAKVFVNVTSLTGIDDLISDLAFSVYPNPIGVLDVCNLQFAREAPRQIFVYDEVGREIFKERITTVSYQLPTVNWTSGVYFIKAITDTETSVKKIVKQ